MKLRYKETIPLLVIIVIALFCIQIYIKRGVQGRLQLNKGEESELSKLAQTELKKFHTITKGMTQEEVEKLVGYPDRKTNNGLDIDAYLLSDGTEVSLGWMERELKYVIHNHVDLLIKAE